MKKHQPRHDVNRIPHDPRSRPCCWPCPLASPWRSSPPFWLDIEIIEQLTIYGWSGWWFGTFFISHNIWDNPSHWRIFFKMVKTTNQWFIVDHWWISIDEYWWFIDDLLMIYWWQQVDFFQYQPLLGFAQIVTLDSRTSSYHSQVLESAVVHHSPSAPGY